jgi:hypothetical protein
MVMFWKVRKIKQKTVPHLMRNPLIYIYTARKQSRQIQLTFYGREFASSLIVICAQGEPGPLFIPREARSAFGQNLGKFGLKPRCRSDKNEASEV